FDHGAQGARGSDAIDETPVESLGSAEPAPEQHHLLRAPGADQTRETLAASTSRDETEVRVLVAEARRLVGDHEIRDQSQLEPPPPGQPVDAGHHPPGARLHPNSNAS